MAPTPRWSSSLSPDAGGARPPFDPELRSQAGFAIHTELTPIGALRSAPVSEQELISAGVRRRHGRLPGWKGVAIEASVLEVPAVGGEMSSAEAGTKVAVGHTEISYDAALEAFRTARPCSRIPSTPFPDWATEIRGLYWQL